jgi:ribosomal protein L37AE/L43A
VSKIPPNTPPCPSCKSRWVQFRQRDGMIHCRSCGNDYKNYDWTPVAKKPGPKPSLPACPQCKSRKLRRMDNRQSLKCRACEHIFPLVTAKYGKGSGVIAGRITHGRGSVWGASII